MASKVLRELTIKLDADLAELKKDMAKASKSLSKFEKKVNGMGRAFKQAFSVVAIVAVGKQLIDVAGEMSELGKELEGVQNGFEGIDPQILQDMKKATHGTVSDLELMKAAVQAKNFALPVGELATMLEFVHRRARASGDSVKQLTADLVKGLGRKSAMIIDNLGISTSQLNAQLKKTPDFTTAVAEIMKEDMKAAGEYIETAADITQRWGAEWMNTKAKIGLFINKGIKLIAPHIEELRKDMGMFFKKAARWLFDAANYWITLYNEAIVFRALVNAIGLTFKTVWITVKTFFKATTAIVKGVGELFSLVFDPKNWGKGFGAKLKKVVVDGFDAVKMDIKEGGNEWKKELDKSVKAMGGTTDLLVWKNIVNTEQLKTDAEKTGEEVGESLNKGIKKGLAPKEDTDPQPLPNFDVGRIAEAGAAAKEEIKASVDGINALLADSLGSSIVGIAENATKGIESLGQGIMGALLNFAQSFGKILIGIGISREALEKIGFTGIPAIIAGGALIAGVAAIRALMKDGPAFAQGGIVPGNSYGMDRVPIVAKSGEMMLNHTQQSQMFKQLNSPGGGNGGQLVAVVSGSDLKFILDEANRQNNNSF